MSATDGDDAPVGLASGGPRVTQLYLARLEAIGIHGWLRPEVTKPTEPPTFAVFVAASDADEAKTVFSRGLSPQELGASDADYDEHLENSKQQRPWAEVWWEDDPDRFGHLLAERMSRGQAQAIKIQNEDATYRAIAATAHELYAAEWRLGWSLPGDQGVGIAICYTAEDILNDEDDSSHPWPSGITELFPPPRDATPDPGDSQ